MSASNTVRPSNHLANMQAFRPLWGRRIAAALLTLSFGLTGCGGGGSSSGSPVEGGPPIPSVPPGGSFTSGSLLQLPLPAGQDPNDVQAEVAGKSAAVVAVGGETLVKLPGLPTGDYPLRITTSAGVAERNIHVDAPVLDRSPADYATSMIDGVISKLDQALAQDPAGAYAPTFQDLRTQLVASRAQVAVLTAEEQRELAYNLAALQAQLSGTGGAPSALVLAINLDVNACNRNADAFVRDVAGSVYTGAVFVASAISTTTGLGAMLAATSAAVFLQQVYVTTDAADQVAETCSGSVGDVTLQEVTTQATDNFQFATDAVTSFRTTVQKQVSAAAASKIEGSLSRMAALLRTAQSALNTAKSLLSLQNPADLGAQATKLDHLTEQRAGAFDAGEYTVTVGDARIGVLIKEVRGDVVDFQPYFTGTPVEGDTPFVFSIYRTATNELVASKAAILHYTSPVCEAPPALVGTHTFQWYVLPAGTHYEDDTVVMYADGNGLYGSTPITWEYNCTNGRVRVGQGIFQYVPNAAVLEAAPENPYRDSWINKLVL